MKKRHVVIAFTVVCMLSFFTLFGCGSGGNNSKSDEQLIKENIASVVGSDVSASELASEFRADDEFMQLAQLMDLDIDRFSSGLAKLFSASTTAVKVEGDKATATVSITYPDFLSMYDLLDKKLDEWIATIDISTVTETDYYKGLGKLFAEVIEDPEMPTASKDIEIPYSKNGGNWKMDDQDAIEKVIKEAMSTF